METEQRLNRLGKSWSLNSNELAGKRICYVFQDEYPWDVRVEKIVTSLATHGCDVHLISRNRSSLPLIKKINDRLTVHRLSCSKFKLFRNIVNTPAFFSPFWIKKIFKIAKENNANLLIVRDLPLTITVLFVGRVLSIPVLFDMAENYPAMIAGMWKYRGKSIADLFLRNPYFLKIMEKAVLPRFAGVLVVSKQSKVRIEALGVDEKKISVIENTPIVKKSNALIKLDYMQKICEAASVLLLYVGGLEEARGLSTVIDALPLIIEQIPGIKFVIVGDGISKQALLNQACKAGVENNVCFVGWRDHADVASIISYADICIVPHFVTDHVDTTLPNKIYDYMLQKKPVVVTQAKSLTALVQKYTCGVSYLDSDPEDLAQKIISLDNIEYRRKLGAAGHCAIMQKLNWGEDKRKLFKIVQLCST